MSTIAVIGLGYVGLPLAVEFGKKMKTVGFDLHQEKVDAYARHVDPTGEVSTEDLKAAVHLTCSTDPKIIGEADFIIVAVPTPVDEAHQPDFTPLVKSSESVGKHMKRGAIVVYESTVYPGATEEVCIPILEKFSGLKWKQDFNVGYSPERINPGDKERTVTKIMKVVSGDTPETLKKVEEVYGSVITAGVYPASSIKVAEAAKVIENTQRDLNIALMNELSVIFHKIGIDTLEVLKAAGTKWNFLPFRPGLVGGHCIGVDPYYLTHKADMLGYHPQVILAGRRINDSMGKYVAEADRQADDPERPQHQGRRRHRAGPHLQGKLPRSAQQQGHRRDPRTAEFRLQRAGARPGGRVRRSRARVRREPDGLGRSAPCGCHCGCGGSPRIRRAGRGAAVREAGGQWRVHRCEERL
jgi:UDP-N-acetyl-D-galactosamine dehydrogenase